MSRARLETRKPEAYRPDDGGHFRRRERERGIPRNVVTHVIENGEIVEKRSRGNRLRLRAQFRGAYYWVVLDVGEMVVVSTGMCGQ